MFAKLRLLLGCVLVAAPAPTLAQMTIHIPADQPTIQAGINAAHAGDTVLVAPGTYYENLDFKGKAITVTSSDGAAVTIVSGAMSSPTVQFVSGETRASTLRDLTLTGGGTGLPFGQAVHSGAIYLDASSPSILDNTITNARCFGITSQYASALIEGNNINQTLAPENGCYSFAGAGPGAAIVLYEAQVGLAPLLLKNTLEHNNQGGQGLFGAGGLVVDYTGALFSAPGSVPSPPVIQSNIIRYNSGASDPNEASAGGGVTLYNTGGLLLNNLIYQNIASFGGGGVAIMNANGVVLVNNTIADNNVVPSPVALPGGGTQLFFDNNPVSFVNNIVSGSTAAAAIICGNSNAVNPFGNNDAFNAGGPVAAGFQGSTCLFPAGSSGNLSVDPIFVGAPAGNYRLLPSSPAIDAGTNAAIQIAAAQGISYTTDLDGNPRLVDGTGKGTATIDMGAYEYQAEPPTTLSLVCNPSSIPLGGASILSAAITAAGSVPGGALSLTDNGAAIAQLPLVNGTATYSYQGVTAGNHLLSVTFAPTATLGASNASCTVSVSAIPTTATLIATPLSSVFGAAVTLSATVQPSAAAPGTPTGTVSFLNGTTAIGSAQLVNGIATFTAANLPGGTDGLTCTYAGSTTFAPSTCNILSATVAPAASALTLTPSQEPAIAGTPFTVTVHLAGPTSSPPPSGQTVALDLPGGISVSLTLDASGTATDSVTLPSPGISVLTANFGGSANLLPSSASLAEAVSGVATTTALSASPNPAYTSQPVTLTATVTASSAPAGPVSFYDGQNLLGTAPLTAAGQATLTTTALSPGTHTLIASFAPTAAFTASASPPVSETILASGFTLNLSPANLALPAGGQGTVAVQLGSLGNFAGPLTLTQTGLPSYTSATFVPSPVNLVPGGNGSATLLLNTAVASPAIPARPGTRPWPLLFSAILLLPLGSSRFRRLRGLCLTLLAAALLGSVAGCTTIRTPFELAPLGSYPVLVTATDSQGHQRTATLHLTVTTQ